MFKRVIASLFLFWLLPAVHAGEQARNRPIDGLVHLPVNGLQMVQSGERIYFMSDNGRFVFKGYAFDLWNGERLETLDDARRLADRIDLRKMGLDLDDLAPFRLGRGERTVTVFIDPYCPYCHKLLGQMDALKDRYRFQLLMVPVLGDRSAALIRRLACLDGPDRNDEVVRRLIEQDFEGLAGDEKPCDTAPLQRTLVTAQILGVGGVPFLIADDNRVLRGYTPDLARWLADPS